MAKILSVTVFRGKLRWMLKCRGLFCKANLSVRIVCSWENKLRLCRSTPRAGMYMLFIRCRATHPFVFWLIMRKLALSGMPWILLQEPKARHQGEVLELLFLQLHRNQRLINFGNLHFEAFHQIDYSLRVAHFVVIPRNNLHEVS